MIKVFQVRLVQSIANDFDVEFIQIVGTETVGKVRGYTTKKKKRVSRRRVWVCWVGLPKGVSTRTVLKSSATVVATQSAGIESNTPKG